MKNLNNSVKTTEKLLLILVLILLALVAHSAPTTKQIESWQLPCEHVENGCIEYALTLTIVLSEKHVPCRMVVYDRGVSIHAVVLFESDGKTFLIDNETDKANRVKGKTDLQLVRSFDKQAISLKNPSNAYGPEVSVYVAHLQEARSRGNY